MIRSLIFLFFCSFSFFQVNGQALNTVTTAVPFLLITPDARAGGMGDVGVATSPDAFSTHWNPSKLAFSEKKFGVSGNYSPWLRTLVPGINLFYFSGFHKLKEDQVISSSFKVFSLGKVAYLDGMGNVIGVIKPIEYSADLFYSKKLTPSFSIGIGARFIRSDLLRKYRFPSNNFKAGNSLAGDFSVFYTKPELPIGNKKGIFSFGLHLSNLGSKISYTKNQERKDFIPANLRTGSAFSLDVNEKNKLTFALDFNKLLVPTSPIYETYPDGTIVLDSDSQGVILQGKDPNRSVIAGALGSFNDAPGGFREELREINTSIGLEYSYDGLVFLRTGRFFEHPSKGDRNYFTFGVGISVKGISVDFSYLEDLRDRYSVISQTKRISLRCEF